MIILICVPGSTSGSNNRRYIIPESSSIAGNTSAKKRGEGKHAISALAAILRSIPKKNTAEIPNTLGFIELALTIASITISPYNVIPWQAIRNYTVCDCGWFRASTAFISNLPPSLSINTKVQGTNFTIVLAAAATSTIVSSSNVIPRQAIHNHTRRNCGWCGASAAFISNLPPSLSVRAKVPCAHRI